MNIVQLVDKKVLSVVEKILKLLEGDMDYQGFELQLKEELDGLGCEILKMVFEELDEGLRGSKERKQHWTVVRKGDPKRILTPFGNLEYKRSYYRHKESKKCCYLADEKVGIKPHSRVSGSLKGELIDASAVMSYESATVEVSRYNPQLKVSRQTVGACVKEFKAKEEAVPEEKRKATVLYVEADEDHIKIKGKNRVLGKLIYIHEGVEESPRRHLKNAKYFTTAKKGSDEFWYEIAEYIATHYDLESIETVYLAGDGNEWIKVGLEYICDAIFVLDKFHLNKYINAATEHAKDLRKPIRHSIQTLNQNSVMKYLREAFERAEGTARKTRVGDAATYIKNQWDGIEAQVKHPHVGCSAEGHVSHILAARMSSRPMAWSSQGADNMAQMRAIRANGETVKEHYLTMQETVPVITELKNVAQEKIKNLKKRKSLGKESLNNVPLFKGVNNLTRTALKGLNKHLVI